MAAMSNQKKWQYYLYRFRWVFLVAASCSLSAIIYGFLAIETQYQDEILIPAILSFLWLLLLYLAVGLYMPADNNTREHLSFIQNIKLKLAVLLRKILLFIVILLVMATIVFSYKLATTLT